MCFNSIEPGLRFFICSSFISILNWGSKASAGSVLNSRHELKATPLTEQIAPLSGLSKFFHPMFPPSLPAKVYVHITLFVILPARKRNFILPSFSPSEAVRRANRKGGESAGMLIN